jgi:hypothetical protein
VRRVGADRQAGPLGRRVTPRDAGQLGLDHPRAPGRQVALHSTALRPRSAISASCSPNWPDRKRSTNISEVRRHSLYDHKIETYRLGGCIVRRRAATI